MVRQSGQAVLIVLLGMAIALTAVLSILGATTTDIKLSTNESESLRAFSAAEAGIEQSLVTNNSIPSQIIANTNAKYSTTVSSFGKGMVQFPYPQPVPAGESATLWFVSHLSNGLGCNVSDPGYTGCFTGRFFNIYWGQPGTNPNQPITPAIEVLVYFLTTPGDYSTAKVSEEIYDPNSSRRLANSYGAPNSLCNTSPPCLMGSNSYAFEVNLDLGFVPGTYWFGVPTVPPSNLSTYINGPQFVVVKMLYNSAVSQPIAFETSVPLPSQGNQVDSTGTLNTSTRKIEVIRSFNDAPGVFDSAVFSSGGVSQ